MEYVMPIRENYFLIPLPVPSPPAALDTGGIWSMGN